MVRSELTTKFHMYVLGQTEKRLGKSVMDFIDVGNLEVNKIIFLIQLGNSSDPKNLLEEELAAQKLETYLEKEGNNLITAFIDLLGDFDIATGVISATGQSPAKLKAELLEQLRAAAEETTSKAIGSQPIEFPIQMLELDAEDGEDTVQ